MDSFIQGDNKSQQEHFGDIKLVNRFFLFRIHVCNKDILLVYDEQPYCK